MPSKIMFVNQPVTLEKRYNTQSKLGNNTPPLTLCHLAALTKKFNHPTVILDAATLRLSVEETLARILEEMPTYLALYGTTLTIEDAARLACLAKEQLKDLIVIVGGVHFTYNPGETMRRYPTFDVGVVGEGDITVVELLDSYEVGRGLIGVKGIIFRKGGNLAMSRN